MNAPLYTIDILRLAGSLPDAVALDRVDGRAELRSPTCGSSVLTEVRMEGGRVSALSQTVRACAFGQASAALLAQQAVGKSGDELLKTLVNLTAWLDGAPTAPDGLEALAPARSRRSRHGAILLPFRALQAAVNESKA